MDFSRTVQRLKLSDSSHPTVRQAGRRWLGITYALVIGGLAVSSASSLLGSAWSSEPQVLIPALSLLIITGYMVWYTSREPIHRLAWSTFWAWSFTFLGLATSYQLAASTFPWGGVFASSTITTAIAVALVGQGSALAGYLLVAWWHQKRQRDPSPALDLSRAVRTHRLLVILLIGHSMIGAIFVALMGSAMVSGKAEFSARLVSLSNIPGTGSAYFLSTAGAITLPAMAITLRRRGLPISIGWIALSLSVSAVVLNPFIGSRFLTGSLLFAVSAAVASAYWRRWIPLGLVVAFCTVFPSLDLFRGNATGSSGLAIAHPREALITFDFDAFEMLIREVSLNRDLPSALPSTTDLFIAPFLRWIPVVSNYVAGDASGPAVAESTGMGFTNVSMPLWGEMHLVGGWAGVIVAFALLGWFLRLAGSQTEGGIFGLITDAPVAALLVVVLRGSLYEVLGYLLLAAGIGWWLNHAFRRDQAVSRPKVDRNSLAPTEQGYDPATG